MLYYTKSLDLASLSLEQLLMEYFTFRKALESCNSCTYEKLNLRAQADRPQTSAGVTAADNLELAFMADCFPEPFAITELSLDDTPEPLETLAYDDQPAWTPTKPPAAPEPQPPASPAENRGAYSESEFMRLLYSEISERLLPAVDEVLNAYEAQKSPIYNTDLDRETAARIVGQVLELAAATIPEVAAIAREMNEDSWNRYMLLRSLVESLVLNEIFTIRRPNRRRMKVVL